MWVGGALLQVRDSLTQHKGKLSKDLGYVSNIFKLSIEVQKENTSNEYLFRKIKLYDI